MASPSQHREEETGRRGETGGNAERLRQSAREVQQETQALATSARQAMDALRGLVRERVETHPYGVLGLALGAGWVLGGGLPLRAVVFVGGVGARLAAQELLRTLRAETAHEPPRPG